MAQTKVQLLQPDLGDVIDFDSSTLFMDGADNRVGIRNTNPQYELDVTGTVRATNFIGTGSTTIPDWIVHDGDTNTKFGFPANDKISFHTSGSERLHINTIGYLGINDSGPNARLTVRGDSDTSDADCQLRIYDIDSTAGSQIPSVSFWGGSTEIGRIRGTDTAGMRFYTANSGTLAEKMSITSAGRVQIGTSGLTGGDDMGLVVANPANDGKILELATTASNGRLHFSRILSNTLNTTAIIENTEPGAQGTGDLRFYTSPSSNNPLERLRITSDGQIGVNNTSPDAWHTQYRSLQIYDAAVLYGSQDDSFVGLGANHFLNTSGDFKYSNTDFASRFYQVNGGFHFESVASGTAGNTFSFTERVRITSDGSVRIGGSTPVGYSAHSAVDDIVVGGTSSHGITVLTGNSSTGNLWFDSENGNRGYIQYAHNEEALILGTENNERLRIDSSGAIIASSASGYHADADDLVLKERSGGNVGMTLLNTGTGYGVIYFGDNSDNNAGRIQYDHSNDSLDLFAGGSERASIDGNGMLHISDRNSGNAGEHVFQAGSFGIRMADTGGYNRWNIERNYGGWQSTPIVHLSAQGRVGINEGLPEELLHITHTSAPGIQLESTAGGPYKSLIKMVGNDLEIRGSSGQIEFYTGNADGDSSTEKLRITDGGVIRIGGATDNSSDIDSSNTKLTIKQTANNQEDGIYLERSGERRGYYMYVGGAGGLSDALCITTNQLGTDTHCLAIDRGNRLVKLGGEVIIDSTNNGYGGLRIYDDSAGDYNVRYIAGRNQSATAHVFMDGGRNQNQTPWTAATANEAVRLTRGKGISFKGVTSTWIGLDGSANRIKIQTEDKDAVYITQSQALVAAKIQPKVIQWSGLNSRYWNNEAVKQFVITYYTGASGSTYHVCRMISQTDWGFDNIEFKIGKYQYNPASDDLFSRRFTTYYSSHSNQLINYNQQGSGSGTGAWGVMDWRQDFGPSGSHTIHQQANGGYYRDCYGSDVYVSLGAYTGIRVFVTVWATAGLYDTGNYATAYDFYPANFQGTASQTNADNWGGPRGTWFNTSANGTGTGSNPGVFDFNTGDSYGQTSTT